MKEKELVTLRKRGMKNGGSSLYLDYTVDGVRTREFLKMYIVPEHTKIDKIQNQETLKAAIALKTKRIVELQEGKAGIKTVTRKDVPLTDFINEMKASYKEEGKHFYVQALTKLSNWLGKYGRKTTLKTIDKGYIMGFCRFMETNGLSRGSVFLHFSILRTVLNKAYRAGLMRENVIAGMEADERPKRPDTEREYLTLDEIRKLMEVRCRNESTERAFLFSCFTGLRISDIETLTWEKIRDNGHGLQVEAKQVKTGKVVYVPLSSNAISQLPSPSRKKGKVFTLPARSTIGEYLDHWVKKAGIPKHISFHCARHTYATLLLTYGANIYTVSSLLGHTNVQTTQIYAKIVDENKRRTVDLIPDIGER